MPLSSRPNDPILDRLARDTFALFPDCHICGRRIDTFEEADVRVHVQRVVHRDGCPAPGIVERVADGAHEGPDAERHDEDQA